MISTSSLNLHLDYKTVVNFFKNSYEDYNEKLEKEYFATSASTRKYKLIISINDNWTKIHRTITDKIEGVDSSVYSGNGGIALLYLLKYKNNIEHWPGILNLIKIEDFSNKRISFICGDAGPLAIQAMIHQKLGHEDECQKLIDMIISMKEYVLSNNPKISNEVMYGRSGYLFTLLYLKKYVKSSAVHSGLIKSVIGYIIQNGVATAKEGNFKIPLMYQWHDDLYLGAAHGVAGILYMLLQAVNYVDDKDVETLIKPTINSLVQFRFHSGNFPITWGSNIDDRIQWCHGAPGFVYLFTLAYEIFQEQFYLNVALELGDLIWQRGLLMKGYSFCHGVSGNGYSFLNLYQATKDSKHLYRAYKFGEWILDYKVEREALRPRHPMTRRISLFEGKAGQMHYLLDLLNPDEAKFPAFTL